MFCRIDTYWDLDFDCSLTNLLILSDGMFVIDCYRVETKSLVEGFIRDWGFEIWENMGNELLSFPHLGFLSLVGGL